MADQEGNLVLYSSGYRYLCSFRIGILVNRYRRSCGAEGYFEHLSQLIPRAIGTLLIYVGAVKTAVSKQKEKRRYENV